MSLTERKRSAHPLWWCAAAALCGLGAPALAQSTVRASLGPGGAQSNDHSWQAWISGNGRCVAFESLASNLVPGDTNGRQDIFVHDRVRQMTLRVSIASDGAQADGESARPSISYSGRYIAFQSNATNLVAGDTNNAADIFVHDLRTGETVRASVDSFGGQSDGRSIHPAISADGSAVVFHSEARNLDDDPNPQWDVFVHDFLSGKTTLDSIRTDGGPGNDWSEHPTISGDGALIAYHSDATNLVDDDTNNVEDVFVFDRATRITRRITLDPFGAQADKLCVFPSFAADGGYVAFESDATNLVPGDTNQVRDILVCELATGLIRRASLSSAGEQPDADCFTASISRDGRYVAFYSAATNLVPGDANGLADAFVRDMLTGQTFRASVGPGGLEADGPSNFTTISAGGRFIAFQSSARNLLGPGRDSNIRIDVFVHDLAPRRAAAALSPLP